MGRAFHCGKRSLPFGQICLNHCHTRHSEHLPAGYCQCLILQTWRLGVLHGSLVGAALAKEVVSLWVEALPGAAAAQCNWALAIFCCTVV
jgi:hypothetical protein